MTSPSKSESSPDADTGIPEVRLRLDDGVVRLRPVLPEDYPFLRALETGSDIAASWRFRGATPSPEQWAQSVWGGVLAQFVVADISDGRPLGVVSAYKASFQDGYVWLAALSARPGQLAPGVVRGFILLVEYVFLCWNFRKVYLEVAEYNLPQFASSVGRIFEREGTLREHRYLAGRYWDQITLSLTRERCEALRRHADAHGRIAS